MDIQKYSGDIMKVKELIKHLKKYNANSTIYTVEEPQHMIEKTSNYGMVCNPYNHTVSIYIAKPEPWEMSSE